MNSLRLRKRVALVSKYSLKERICRCRDTVIFNQIVVALSGIFMWYSPIKICESTLSTIVYRQTISPLPQKHSRCVLISWTVANWSAIAVMNYSNTCSTAEHNIHEHWNSLLIHQLSKFICATTATAGPLFSIASRNWFCSLWLQKLEFTLADKSLSLPRYLTRFDMSPSGMVEILAVRFEQELVRGIKKYRNDLRSCQKSVISMLSGDRQLSTE